MSHSSILLYNINFFKYIKCKCKQLAIEFHNPKLPGSVPYIYIYVCICIGPSSSTALYLNSEFHIPNVMSSKGTAGSYILYPIYCIVYCVAAHFEISYLFPKWWTIWIDDKYVYTTTQHTHSLVIQLGSITADHGCGQGNYVWINPPRLLSGQLCVNQPTWLRCFSELIELITEES